MKIKNIKINHFGNLENKEINLENKINIIYGKNESGKSTLLNYIKNIFYGISKNKNGKEISDYEKYKPWMKKEFSGKIKYELDNGNRFEIIRDFNKKNPKIFNEKLEEISNEFNIDKKDGVQFFYDQTNVDEMMFLSTVVSMQQEVKLEKQEQSILVQKIANLAGTGDDNVSFKRVIDQLNKKQLEEIGSDRTQEKPINIVKKRMNEISFVIKDMNSCQEKLKEIQEKKSKIIQENILLNIKNNIFKKLNIFYLEKNIEKEKIKIKNKIINENKEKIKKINIENNNLNNSIKEKQNNYLNKFNNNNNNNLFENKINTENNNKKINEKEEIINNKENRKNKNKNKNKIFILLGFIIIMIIFKLLNNIIFKNNLLNYFIYSITTIYILYFIIKNILNKNKEKKIEYEQKLKKELNEEKEKLEKEKLNNEIILLEKQVENYDRQIKEIEDENLIIAKEIETLQLNLDNKLDIIIEQIKKEYADQIDIDQFMDMIKIDDIENDIQKVQEIIQQNQIVLNSIEIEQKNIEEKLENIISLKEEYSNLEEELNNLKEKSENIFLTKEYLNKAYDEMKSTITPKFTENLSKNISDISNGKYKKVMINDEKGLIVENEYGDYIPADRLSIGTIDQLYLSLRLSMIDEISTETMPIILDEAFAYYDDSRLENILKFLLNRAEKNQIIIFSCTKREQEILDRLGVIYNLVELS